MMNKEVYLKNIAENLALLSREVSILNAVNLYDINIIAEDFFPGLLNLIYGYELKNANHLEKNAPAIDLIDQTIVAQKSNIRYRNLIKVKRIIYTTDWLC